MIQNLSTRQVLNIRKLCDDCLFWESIVCMLFNCRQSNSIGDLYHASSSRDDTIKLYMCSCAIWHRSHFFSASSVQRERLQMNINMSFSNIQQMKNLSFRFLVLYWRQNSKNVREIGSLDPTLLATTNHMQSQLCFLFQRDPAEFANHIHWSTLS